MVKIKSLIYFCIFVSSCQSIPSEVPSWVLETPKDDSYFIGIDSVSSLESSDYRAQAYNSALVRLASQISVNIKSVSEGIQTGTLDEMETQFKRTIEKQVAANLKNVVIVDEYMSETGAYWVYLQLSKEDWENQVALEKTNLTQRIKTVVNNLETTGLQLSERLSLLKEAFGIIEDSPLSTYFTIEYDSNQITPYDLVLSLIIKETNNVNFELNSIDRSKRIGEPASLDFQISSNNIVPGEIQVKLVDTKTGELLNTITTAKDGRYKGLFETTGLGVGINSIGIVLSDLEVFSNKFWNIEIELSLIPLEVSFDSNISDFSAENRLLDLLSAASPYHSIDKSISGSEYKLMVSMEMFQYPVVEDLGIVFVETWLNFELVREGETISNYTTPKVKEGGLNFDQAIERSFSKLLDSLQNQSDLISLFEM